MKYRELYTEIKNRLAAAEVESPAEDSLALLEHFCGVNRTGLALHGDDTPESQAEQKLLAAAEQRAARTPLQYILGEWEFMGLTLSVGEGVLIPREDTGILIEAAAERLKEKNAPVGLDLCAGTGAVALGLCNILNTAAVTCVELSPLAMPYLQKNIAAHPQFNVKAAYGDVLNADSVKDFAGEYDFIVSNPPYISADELNTLQAEVQKEPDMALNGGEDGLVFYRAIVRHWLPLIKPGGVLAVEIGEDQGDSVCKIFAKAGLCDIKLLQDWAGLDRCVIGNTAEE